MSDGTNNQNRDNFFSRSQQRIEEQRAAEAAAAAAGRPARIVVGPTGRFETYTGPGLVTDDGQILRDSETGQIITEYNLDSDPEQYYRSFSPAARNNLMEKLYKAGFFSVGKPGDFLDELNALKNAMYAGNLFGMDVQHVANARIANMPVQPGTGVRRRVTAAEDLKTIAKQVSRQTIGRELSEEQLNRFIASYQGVERAGGVGGEQPMSADVAAQKFTQEQEPIESRGYQYLSYMKDLFSAIGPVGGGSA